MLHYMIIFSVLLICAVNVQAHCEAPDGGENQILTEETNNAPFPGGSTVRFKCALGYVPVNPSASRSITCNGNQWSDLELQCEKKSCGNPEEIANGKYQMPDGILFGATINAVCDEGYQLVGKDTRNCRMTGWDGRAPTCKAQCERPDFGENWILTNESNKPPFLDGSTVRFKCAPGYVTLRPSASRTITCNGTQWSDLELQCKRKSCGNPGEIANGKYQTPDGILFGATIKAVCNDGYQLVGQATRNCREDGWDERAPTCEAVTCDSPSIQNAVISGPGPYRYGISVQIKCNEGQRMEWSDSLTCGEHGWTPSLPRCVD